MAQQGLNQAPRTMGEQYLMSRSMKRDGASDDEIRAYVEGMKKDKQLGFREDEGGGGSW